MICINTRRVAWSLLALFAALGHAPATRAQTLDVTLTDPNQTVTSGTTVVAFDATIFNPSVTQTIYLNADSFSTSTLGLNVNDAPFWANAPIDLAPGQSSGTIELFDVDLAPGIAAGNYASNDFSILGGADGGALSAFVDLADANFSVSVTGAGSIAAPELDPSGAVSAFLLLAGFAAILRGSGPGAAPRVSFARGAR